MEKRFTKRLKTFIAAGSKSTTAPYFTVPQSIQDELITDVEALLQEAASIGATHAQTMLKSHHRAVLSGARNWLAHARDIVAGLIDHVRESISNALSKGQSDDSDGEALSQTDIVDTTINDLIDELPELVAETETTSAIESSVLDTLKSGGVQRVRWVAEPDACPMCQELAESGAIDADGEFEGGLSSPPAHPRCKCNVIAVGEGD